MKGELVPAICHLGCSLSFPLHLVAPGYEMSLSPFYSNVKVQVTCNGKMFYPIVYQPVSILSFGCTGQD